MKNYSAENCIICNTDLIGGKDYRYCTCDDYAVDLTSDGLSIVSVQFDFYHRSTKHSVQVNYKKKFSTIVFKNKYHGWEDLYTANEALDLPISEWKILINRVLKLKTFK